ncbi:thiamine phosphate synthase [Leptospira saintgironsiae]|uniref:Thiamine phosphate synthase n=1 Tax=Leptospira saintgironsiae TaxID=2023183 RepID=A0A2M9YF46_9LEPT|nr:thiamine phosphate synthase [Leptospira saintgironsiae]PJZ50086.1 thiamine phosphate synthase [Leptospira saintgironsiae]
MEFPLRPRHSIWRAPGIYPILDLEYCSKFSKDPVRIVELWNYQREWIPFYQIRAKKETPETLKKVYKSLIDAFPDFPIILNDFWKEALEWRCFGLHIGKEDYTSLSFEDKKKVRSSGLYLGTSCHNSEDIANLEPGVWDYTGLGPVYATSSKDTEDVPVGLEGLKEALQIAKIPVTPIGGIGPKQISELSELGPLSYAMIASASERDSFYDCIRILKEIKNP